MNLIFRLFDYILKAPVLEDVKIEEVSAFINDPLILFKMVALFT